jgi:S1-C subfamily serine protease
MVGCTKPIVADTIPETITVYETVITTEIVEIENTDKINELELELQQYKELISNLNNLLSNVYYMECENAGYSNWGTGFSIAYNDTFYILTAGHYVEDIEHGTGKYSNFKFKVNDEWIYPELLHYEVTDYLPDYAIFYSDKISSGLDYDLVNTEPDYRLGIDVLIEENNNWGEQGSCGSPIIDLDGEVIGLHVGYLQDIDIVLDKIK